VSANFPSADVAVIGGGIVGVCTALQLQRTGRNATVIERGIIGNEASGHNGGLFSGDCVPVATPSVIRSLPSLLFDKESPLAIRARYLPSLTPWLIRFALASRPSRVEAISVALHSLMSRSVDAYRPLLTGTDAEQILRDRGYLYAYRHRRSLDSARYNFDLRKRRGVAFEILSATELAAREPLLDGLFEAGVYFPNAHFVRDPRALAQILHEDFLARGGRSVSAAVIGFVTRGRRVERVRTDRGEISVGTVVIAAGPWSGGLLRHLGSAVPLVSERGYGVDIPAPGIHVDVPVIVAEDGLGMTPHRGGLRIGAFDELASISAPPDMRLNDRAIHMARRMFPALRTDGATMWMRRRPSTPDSLAVIGRAPRFENAYLNFGHGHKGMGQAAITGKLMQEFMDGQPTTVDLAPFDPERFRLFARES
jgi:D-amino-acid dehydrogenase